MCSQEFATSAVVTRQQAQHSAPAITSHQEVWRRTTSTG